MVRNLAISFETSLMNPKYVAIWFDDEKELDLALAWNYRFFLGINFKIFQWRPGFNTKVDPKFILVWVEISFSRYEFFAPNFKQ